MRKLLFILLISSFASAQNFAKDTLLSANQPASILKIGKTKIYIVQNKDKQTPYVLQKDGSFISKGVPYVTIAIDKKYSGDTNELIKYLFLDEKDVKGQIHKEIIESGETNIFISTIKLTTEKRLGLNVTYPLSDRFINMNLWVNYLDDKDADEKYEAITDIIKNGFIVLENYYQNRKI
ncbi:hypothetical protein [Flavobacterium piscisymbiosum]|uniref:Uncharacterized protein n=1 Tax=Flavobacterium piscisymbiosum TaxID=2893753 RepID=A0ABS8MBW4_9FLAO|nr:hypothetical protein [Flavobacterium sp. F-30]MCC9062446.1 hypothetical protein [Flavobacterium sp. F-30]